MEIENDKRGKLMAASIGSNHVAAAVYDPIKQQVIKQSYVRQDISGKGIAGNTLDAWTAAVRRSLELLGAPIVGLGVAIPGTFTYKPGASHQIGIDKYDTIFGSDVKLVLGDATGLSVNRIIFRNHCEALVAGEIFAGSGSGYSSVIGLTLGNSFGAAFATNGNCRDLNLGIRPFKDSIAEDYLSARWFLKRYAELSGRSVSGVEKIAKLAPDDRFAKQVFKEFATNLSIFLKGYVDDLEPAILIIGGGIAKASDHFLGFIRMALPGTRVVISGLGEEAVLIGAAEIFRF